MSEDKLQEKQPLIRSFSAGGVVYRKTSKGLTWLIIQPKGKDRRQLPKGLIEKGESSKEAAEREVMEEGGVKVEVKEKINDQKYFFVWEGKKHFKTVTYYLMEFLKETPEGHDDEIEKVEFLPFAEAVEKLTYKSDKETLIKAGDLLKNL